MSDWILCLSAGIFVGTIVFGSFYLATHTVTPEVITIEADAYVAPSGDILCAAYRNWQKKSGEHVETMEQVCLLNMN